MQEYTQIIGLDELEEYMKEGLTLAQVINRVITDHGRCSVFIQESKSGNRFRTYAIQIDEDGFVMEKPTHYLVATKKKGATQNG